MREKQIPIRRDNYLWLTNNLDQPIRIHIKGSSKKYFTQIGIFKYMLKDMINPKTLGIVSHVQKNAKKMAFPNAPSSLYIAENKLKNITTIRNAYEIDIKRAYLVIANRMGLVSDELFERYYSSDDPDMKTAYCMAIGSLASRETRYIYDPESGKNVHTMDVPPISLNAYKSVCYVLDKLMQKVIKKYAYNSIFYWVDAVFVEGNREIVEDICKYINSEGFEVKVTKLSKIVRLAGNLHVYDTDGNHRPFSFSHKSTKKYQA